MARISFRSTAVQLLTIWILLVALAQSVSANVAKEGVGLSPRGPELSPEANNDSSQSTLYIDSTTANESEIDHRSVQDLTKRTGDEPILNSRPTTYDRNPKSFFSKLLPKQERPFVDLMEEGYADALRILMSPPKGYAQGVLAVVYSRGVVRSKAKPPPKFRGYFRPPLEYAYQFHMIMRTASSESRSGETPTSMVFRRLATSFGLPVKWSKQFISTCNFVEHQWQRNCHGTGFDLDPRLRIFSPLLRDDLYGQQLIDLEQAFAFAKADQYARYRIPALRNNGFNGDWYHGELAWRWLPGTEYFPARWRVMYTFEINGGGKLAVGAVFPDHSVIVLDPSSSQTADYSYSLWPYPVRDELPSVRA